MAAASALLAQTQAPRQAVSARAPRKSSGSRAARGSAPRRGTPSTARSDPNADLSAWLIAYVACAQGRFRRALVLCESLARSDVAAIRVRAAVTAGSALRQRHLYDEAEAIESRALRNAPSEERAHLLIGLAADAVGRGDAGLCARRLGAAHHALRSRDWRARVRLDWVRCEHALLTGDAIRAVRVARAALLRSRRAGARRHQAKSLLFLGVSLRSAGKYGADESLLEALRLAEETQAAPIVTVVRSLRSGAKK
ncbi:MAG: hypothetical protein ABR548_00915 [Actinomycetota bacterium]|nr:hypothetical protein [Actinomycetota bacterium]